MIHRFGPFALDEERRELTLNSREVAVQPRVFDLLSYLIDNADRVVSKDELLDAVWDDSNVTEGSLQRAVSIGRRTLREGGLADAIKVYPRQGYRFVATIDHSAPPAPSDDDALVQARAAFGANQFDTACDAFARADEHSALPGHDLERWGESLFAVGHVTEALRPLERAFAAHSAAGDQRGAARAALLMVKLHLDRGSEAVATGWFRRAAGLLDGHDECSEVALLQWTQARLAIARGHYRDALSHAERAHQMATALEDSDCEALALLDRGASHLALGEIEPGVQLHDEVLALALSGALTPRIASTVYCGVIWSCRNRGDWRRAGQWTDEFSRWVQQISAPAFSGVCSLHRAELHHVRGELGAARDEAERACADLPDAAPWAEGEGYRILGDIELAAGNLDAADDAYRRAHELGWEPEPGFALLMVERGRADAAVRALEHAAAAQDWINMQRKAMLLGHLAVVATRAGAHDRAAAAVAELESRADIADIPSLSAVLDQARAAIRVHAGETDEAIRLLRSARSRWHEIGAPLTAAGIGLQLGQLLAESGDREAADLELASAVRVFEQSGATMLKERARTLRERHGEQRRA